MVASLSGCQTLARICSSDSSCRTDLGMRLASPVEPDVKRINWELAPANALVALPAAGAG